eukprot:scpid78182/ scgid33817/ 
MFWGRIILQGRRWTARRVIVVCLHDSIRLLHMHSFEYSDLVCDGAATTLSMLKSMIGTCGAFGRQPSEPNQHLIKAYFPVIPLLPYVATPTSMSEVISCCLTSGTEFLVFVYVLLLP